jgi:hypothetical protein
VSDFPKFVNEEENNSLHVPMTKEELMYVLNTFYKDKSPGPNTWSVGFDRWTA